MVISVTRHLNTIISPTVCLTVRTCLVTRTTQVLQLTTAVCRSSTLSADYPAKRCRQTLKILLRHTWVFNHLIAGIIVLILWDTHTTYLLTCQWERGLWCLLWVWILSWLFRYSIAILGATYILYFLVLQLLRQMKPWVVIFNIHLAFNWSTWIFVWPNIGTSSFAAAFDYV